MPVVTSGVITITDVNDGVNARLSLESFLVVTDSAGANGVFTGAATTLSVMLGSADDSVNWTVSASPSAGVTGSLAGKTYTVTALSADTGYVDLTASRTGYPSMVRRFSLSKAKQGVPGSTGAAGAAGAAGADGIRGTIQTAAATTGSVWSDTEANTAIATAGGVSPIRGDVVTLFNTSTGFSQTRVRTTGGAWAALAAFFGGDVLVDGTIVGSKLAATSLITSSAQISDGLITNAHIANTIQSSNFVSGASGWKIDKSGNAEFNNLIVRSSIVTGAVSDKLYTSYIGPYPGPLASNASVVLATLTIGQTLPHEIRKYSFAHEWIASNNATIEVYRQIRFMYAGVWGAWIDKSTDTLPTTAWQPSGYSATLSGIYDDVEIRLVARRIGSGGSPPVNFIKNVYLTCVNLVK